MAIDLGFPLKAGGSIWRHGSSPSRAEAARAAVGVLEQWDGSIGACDDNDSDSTIEASFPPLRGPRLPIRLRFLPHEFSAISSLTVKLSETDHTVNVETWGRTGIVLPALAALLAYFGTRLVTWHPGLLAPAIGVGVAAAYWFGAWVEFDRTTRDLIKRIQARIPSVGA